jgi:hypothetical protein
MRSVATSKLTTLLRCFTFFLAPGVSSAVLPGGAFGQDAPMTSMMQMDDMLMRTREGSGTAWLPDASPMAAIHAMAGGWSLMLHGNGFLQFIHEGGDRGGSQLGSINWVMGMARRTIAGGTFGLRAMLSAEPFTVPGCGYPILLATGETCDGEPLHDIQHQHDLLMELAMEYQRPLTEAIDVQLYGALAGEPALGPTAFPHRWSAMPNPLAPITHHWFDGTHIAFGVLTAGIMGERWKLEGSLFNGREPDEDRADLDLAELQSYSGRLWWLPNEHWAMQISAGRVNEAEPGHNPGDPRMDMTRYIGSVTYHERVGELGLWAATAAVGRAVEEGSGSNAALIESSLSIRERHTFFGRAEWAEKGGHDLGIESPSLENDTFDLATIALGYSLHLPKLGGWLPGVGGRASVNFVPAALEPFYGSRTPAGFTVFLSMRPAESVMEMSMPMEMGSMSGSRR